MPVEGVLAGGVQESRESSQLILILFFTDLIPAQTMF